MNRYEANKKILTILTILVETYPDMRFSQIMSNFDLVKSINIDNKKDFLLVPIWKDEYYLESETLLERMKTNELLKGE